MQFGPAVAMLTAASPACLQGGEAILSAVSGARGVARARPNWAPSARRQDLHRLAVEEIADIGDDVGIIDPVVLHADVAEMRREHDVVELAEWMVDRQRLDVEHVETGTADAGSGERRDQRLLVDDRPARRVDQE